MQKQSKNWPGVQYPLTKICITANMTSPWSFFSFYYLQKYSLHKLKGFKPKICCISILLWYWISDITVFTTTLAKQSAICCLFITYDYYGIKLKHIATIEYEHSLWSKMNVVPDYDVAIKSVLWKIKLFIKLKNLFKPIHWNVLNGCWSMQLELGMSNSSWYGL